MHSVGASLTDDLLLYIVGRLEDQEAYTATTRVVKMLYLVDVEYYRSFGETATDLDWDSYRFGPYPMAFPDVIRRLGLDMEYEEFSTSAGRQGRAFSLVVPAEEAASRLPARVRYVADRVIRVLGLEDINTILDYVYFKTEPMRNAEFGEPLDFSTIELRSIEAPIYAELPNQAVKALRARLEETLSALRAGQGGAAVPSYRDEAYYEAIAQMDAEAISSAPDFTDKRLGPSPEALELFRQSTG